MKKTIVKNDFLYCDNPNCEKGQWFHLSCVGIKEGEEPDSSSKWFCCKKCEKDFKHFTEENVQWVTKIVFVSAQHYEFLGKKYKILPVGTK